MSSDRKRFNDPAGWLIRPAGSHTREHYNAPGAVELVDPYGSSHGYYIDDAAARLQVPLLIAGQVRPIRERAAIWLDLFGAEALDSGERRICPEDIAAAITGLDGRLLPHRQVRAQIVTALKAYGLVSRRGRAAGDVVQMEWVRPTSITGLAGRDAKDPAVIAAAVRWLAAEGWFRPRPFGGVRAEELGAAIFPPDDGAPRSRTLRAARVLTGLGFTLTTADHGPGKVRRWRFVEPSRGPDQPAWTPSELIPTGY